jgi:hypothetical protein
MGEAMISFQWKFKRVSEKISEYPTEPQILSKTKKNEIREFVANFVFPGLL